VVRADGRCGTRRRSCASPPSRRASIGSALLPALLLNRSFPFSCPLCLSPHAPRPILSAGAVFGHSSLRHDCLLGCVALLSNYHIPVCSYSFLPLKLPFTRSLDPPVVADASMPQQHPGVAAAQAQVRPRVADGIRVDPLAGRGRKPPRVWHLQSRECVCEWWVWCGCGLGAGRSLTCRTSTSTTPTPSCTLPSWWGTSRPSAAWPYPPPTRFILPCPHPLPSPSLSVDSHTSSSSAGLKTARSKSGTLRFPPVVLLMAAEQPRGARADATQRHKRQHDRMSRDFTDRQLWHRNQLFSGGADDMVRMYRVQRLAMSKPPS
jgi:hypothetical protein